MGTWEREQFKELKTAKQVKDVGVGVGIAAVGVGGTYVAYKIGNALYDWGDDAVDWVKKQWEMANPAQVITGLDPLPQNPDGSDPEFRDDGWIIGGAPSPFQVIWESIFGK